MASTRTGRNALLRYPGGKSKALKAILGTLQRHFESEGWDAEYREPFFGGGSVGFGLLEECPQVRRAWFNDRDPAVCSVWETAARHPERLTNKLRDFVPNTEGFYDFKKELTSISAVGDLGNRIEAAFKKIACIRMSRSGYGTMGGPIGGRMQEGKDLIDARYKPEALADCIAQAAELLNSVETHHDVCSCLDFEQVIRAPGKMVVYLDPPYFKQGPKLYQFSFTDDDHYRLADVLRRESRPWLLSYDTHPAISELYSDWAHVEVISLPYSNAGADRKDEFLISNR